MEPSSPLADKVLFVAYVFFGIIVFLQPFIVGVIASQKGRDGLLWAFVVGAIWWGGGIVGFFLYATFAFFLGFRSIALIAFVFSLLPTFLIMVAPSMGNPRPISMRGFRSRMKRRRPSLNRKPVNDEDTDIIWRSMNER